MNDITDQYGITAGPWWKSTNEDESISIGAGDYELFRIPPLLQTAGFFPGGQHDANARASVKVPELIAEHEADISAMEIAITQYRAAPVTFKELQESADRLERRVEAKRALLDSLKVPA